MSEIYFSVSHGETAESTLKRMSIYMEIKLVQSLLLFFNNLSSQFCSLCNIPVRNKQIKKLFFDYSFGFGPLV
jgi:hypothetical protein